MSSHAHHSLLPKGQENQFEEQPFARGTRMVVFRNGDGTALRVPLRTEEQLKQLSSHSPSTPASNGISGYTKQEIKKHDVMFTFLGNSMMPVTPMSLVDGDDHVRTYAVQKLIEPSDHLPDPRHFHLIQPLPEETRRSLIKLIKRVRRMVNEMGLIPDLAGCGNILISHGKRHKGRVYLVDVNNIQPVLSQNWIDIEKLKQIAAIDPTVERIEDLTQRDLREIYHVMVVLRQKFYAVLHPQFLDEYGYPVADVSLSVLQEWERLLGLPDRDDPYRDLIPRFSLREWVVRRVLEDLQGGSPP